jgi:hypothetical protein
VEAQQRRLGVLSASGVPQSSPWSMVEVVNMKTAKTLGLSIPPALLLRVDQVIE